MKHKNFWDKFEPIDVIAIIMITGVMILNWKGVQTMLSTGVAIIIGYYFGRRIQRNGWK